MRVGLKIDLPDLAAVRDGLTPVLELLEAFQIKATFFVALGPDPRARRGLLGRFARGGGPIGQIAGDALMAIPQRGHGLGALPYDVGGWRRRILERDADWTRAQMSRTADAFAALFGVCPESFAAPDCLINANVPLIEADLGFRYAVDTRGSVPYRPATAAGVSACPQLPISLPDIPELLAAGVPLDDIHQHVFMETQRPVLPGHLFSFAPSDPAHLPVLERLLVMWMGSQRKPVPVGDLADELMAGALPVHEVGLLRSAQGVARAVQGTAV